MDAWETLTGNSTLPSGDAWEHLNNQTGGGEGGETVFLIGELSSNIQSVLSINTENISNTIDKHSIISVTTRNTVSTININTTFESDI